MLYIFGIFVAILILAVVGHLLWIFYRFLFRWLIRLLARSRGQTDVDLSTLNHRLFAHLFSVEGLRYWAYLGGVIVGVAVILLLRDYIAELLTIRFVQLAGIATLTMATYLGGWRLCRSQQHRISGTSLMIIGGILLPVNFWYFQEFILQVDRHQSYLVGLICTAVYLLTAIWRSSTLFSYIAPLTFHTSTLLILDKLDYELESYIFISALLAIFYPLAADFLAERWQKQFKSPLILAALGAVLFSAIAFLEVQQLENVYLPVYLFIAAALVLNKIAQIKLDPRYLFLGIPIVVVISLRHLESFDLLYYWFGLFFSLLALGAVLIWQLFARKRPQSPYVFYFQLLPLTLIIFALPVDMTSYGYLAHKLGSLQQIRRLFTSGSLSIDALGHTWQGMQIAIYYLSYLSKVSLVIFLSTGVTCVVAGIIAILSRSKLIGFYSVTALFCCYTIGLLRFWHPLLYGDWYFLWYLGLTLIFVVWLWGAEQRAHGRFPFLQLFPRRTHPSPFVPALYTYGILSYLLTYMLAGIYFGLSLDENYDYYLCTFSVLGVLLFLLLKHFEGEKLLKNLQFAAMIMIIGPFMVSSFVEWTSSEFFMVLTFLSGVIFLAYGWYVENRIYLALASLTIIVEVVYLFFSVEPGELFLKLVLLVLGLILILLGVYFKKKSLSGTLLFAICVMAAGYPALTEAKSALHDDPRAQYLVELVRANPDDALIRARLIHYVEQTFDEDLSEFFSDLPLPTTPDRFQRKFLRDDLSAVSAIRAIEGTLQLDAMRQSVIRDEQPVIDIVSVEPLEIASHDYPAMLKEQREKGKFPDVLAVERIIPADTIYLRFPDGANFLQSIQMFDSQIAPALRLLTTSLAMEGIEPLFEQAFAPSSGSLRELVRSPKVQGITVVIDDPSIHLGSAMVLILETPDEAAAREIITLFPAQPVKTYRRFAIISNNTNALGTIGDVARPLASEADFLYMKSLHIPAEDGFLYLGESFVKRLISPEFRFKDLRRHNCKVNLERLHQATTLYLADRHPLEQVNIENLIKHDYLDAVPVDLTDTSDDRSPQRYQFAPGTETWSHSLYGRLEAFTPLIDLEITHIRDVERLMYERFRWQYQQYFRQYLDPVGIGLSLSENTIRFHTIVLPLIDDPIYTSAISYIGREKAIDTPSYITSAIPSDYGISLLVRSPSLKEILSQRHWVWRPYRYFYREMQQFLDDADIFGSELFLGIGDFGFEKPYTSPQKPYPETLKEWSKLSSELPVVMVQSLEDEQQGQEYVRRLFHHARQSTIQETPVYAFPLLGNIHLYGSVNNNLLTISSSLECQRDMLTHEAGTLEQSSDFYHLTATFQPEHLQQFKPHLFRLIQRQMHFSCKRSLATLQNLLDLYIARYGSPPSSGDLRKLLDFGKLSNLPICPQNGTFSIQDENVVCSVHGSLETYHEPEQISGDFFLNPFSDSLKSLVAQLKFTEEGVISKVEVVLAGEENSPGKP